MDDKETLKLRREWVGQVFGSTCKEGKKRGVAILVHKALGLNVEKTHTSKDGHYIMIVGTVGEVKISILNLYAPNEDDSKFFKDISVALTSYAEGILIVGGDFNCVLNNHLDKQPFDHSVMTRKTKMLRSMMGELGLADVWRQTHLKDRDYTFFSKVHNSYSRIDMFHMLKRDVYKVTDCYIEPITVSDHAPLVLSVALDKNSNPKLWRLNVSLLNNPNVVQSIRQEWKYYLEHNDNGEVSDSNLWEAAKAVIRGKFISLSSKIKKKIGRKNKKKWKQRF